jgi:hypothetical protein
LARTISHIARDARSAIDARGAQDASRAQVVGAWRIAQDRRDGWNAQPARYTGDAWDVQAARDAARDALAARDKRDARSAIDARGALNMSSHVVRDLRDARDAPATLHRIAAWCMMSSWSSSVSWHAAPHLGARGYPRVDAWASPLFGAFVAGCDVMYWTDTTLYWAAKPTVHTEVVQGHRRLHRDDGPAYVSDVQDLWFWHGSLVPEHAVLRPDTITLAEIQNEPNAETRRALRTRYGESRYLADTGARVIAADIEAARKGSAPRMLLADQDGRRWLVGTDGSTSRVYYMEVPPEVETCEQAHRALSGFDERRIRQKS